VHVLTKIFIVLVSLPAVALVPLVAVNARNESSFKGQLEEAKTKAAAAQSALAASESARQAAEANWNAQTQALESKITALSKEAASRTAEATRLQGELSAAKALQASINSNLEILSQTGKANSELAGKLVSELADLRTRVVAAEKQQAELEEALATSESQRDVADAARRALQEEVQRLSEANQQAMETVQRYMAFAGELPTARAGATGGGDSVRIPADRDMACSIIGVTTSGDTKLAEINAGSRDGLREGWVLTIADNGRFLANLRITTVDVNRATGVIELEDAGRGTVVTGQKAIARKGE
jgi:hypothetical protein